MKKMIILAAIAAMACFTGCWTAAKAYTKRTDKDGNVIESYSSVLGTGDKSSQIAAEGMFADGSDEDLGAGFKNAKAVQESSGIEGAFRGLGGLVKEGVNAYVAYKGTTQPVVQQAQPEANYATAVSASQPAATVPTARRSLIKGDGLPEIVILGNRPGCSWCNRLWSSLNTATLSDAACGANIIDADINSNRVAYDERRPSGTNWEYPWVRIYVGGAIVDEFSARGMNQAQVAARASTAIGNCDPAK